MNFAFGLGPQGYWYMPNRIRGIQPHNSFLQFVLEWGVVGSAIFLFLLARAFFRGLAVHIIRAGREVDFGTFKTPSLRNIELTAPYMHDGRLPTLRAVVDHYDRGVKLHPNLACRDGMRGAGPQLNGLLSFVILLPVNRLCLASHARQANRQR